ncbi:MAG: 1-deoxy-D-xylulose-5-phosphate synthase, partial [Clostridia bacterium]|nr:1-deoxy-D-xylulose-5-phosphate synthase [Clostridia bacterium]
MQILPKIKSPGDVRTLNKAELRTLAGEIRQTIIETVAKNGGHLASNLGMVETTIALHTVFDCPEDAIVFDVGHQCYAHKLLTGRYERFETIRQWGGLSGFTNREESPCDTTTAGHSGSALSAAIGIAEAKRIAGDPSWTVAVVGDGSFTNGMVYEALNNLDNRNLRLVFLLNDNEMSISKNVGSLSNYLSFIRTSEGYFAFKMVLRKAFSKIPIVGKGLINVARQVRDTLKRLTNSETFFENLGLKYIGPVSGNDVNRMISVLEEAKSKCCPVIVHAITKKGLGYSPAQEHPERFHRTGGFPLNDTDDGAAAVQNPPKSTF